MIAVAFAPTKQSGAMQVVAPGVSPFVWTNNDQDNHVIMLGGGTVNLIEIAQDGLSFLGTGVLTGMFLLKPGGKLRVTYVVAPLFFYVVSF